MFKRYKKMHEQNSHNNETYKINVCMRARRDTDSWKYLWFANVSPGTGLVCQCEVGASATSNVCCMYEYVCVCTRSFDYNCFVYHLYIVIFGLIYVCSALVSIDVDTK